MERGIVFLALVGIVGLVLLGSIGCDYIEPGYVGIKVKLYGEQKGVEDYPILTGRVWYNRWTEVVYEYPTFMQTVAWTDDINEGSPAKEGITFNSSEGAKLDADIGLNFTLEAQGVPHLFVEFRHEIKEIVATYLRKEVRDAMNRAASQYTAIEIVGSKKQEFLAEANKLLSAQLTDKGFILDSNSLSFLGAPTPEAQVVTAINKVIEATQLAKAAENKVSQSKAEADQQIEEARGEAEAIKAIASANRELAESLTPAVIQYKLLDKWDGVAPKVMGGSDSMNLLVPIPGDK